MKICHLKVIISRQKQPLTSGPSGFRTADNLCAKLPLITDKQKITHVYFMSIWYYVIAINRTAILQSMKELCFISLILASFLLIVLFELELGSNYNYT